MKYRLFLLLAFSIGISGAAQPVQTDIYNLIKKLVTDSTGYENIGDWAVGNAKRYPVKWKADKIEMSNDTSINFFRLGTANVTIKGQPLVQNGTPVTWTVMLKGPRMGYGSFSMISTPSAQLHPKYTIDSLFGKQPYKAKLLKKCDLKEVAGFYYYELKLPKKDMVYLKISWLTPNSNTAVRIDVFDTYSQYQAKLSCPS
jgi:hypothetical protein